MMDPRSKDSIRAIEAKQLEIEITLEVIIDTLAVIYKLVRSTNESTVRKYGGGKKNTVAKVVDKIKGKNES